MNIKSVIILAFILLSNKTFAQVRKEEENIFVLDDSPTIEEFRQILNLQFSKIITGNTFSNIGNYAAIKTTDETLSFSASVLGKKGNVLTLKASGGAIEGVSGFFNNGKLNTNISGELTYHILINPLSNNSIKRDSFERDKLKNEFQKAQDTYREDTIANNHKKELLDLKIKLEKTEAKKVNINNSLKKILSQIKSQESETVQFKKDSLLYEQEKNELELSIIERQKKEMTSDGYFETLREKINIKFDEATTEINTKVINQAIEGINIYWISIGYGIRNDGFKLFDSSLSFENQIEKKEALTHKFNIAISHYNWRNNSNSTYWSTGASFKLGNNLASLDNNKIKDFYTVSTNPNRESFLEQSVFVGEFENNLKELKLFFDYYKFFKISDANNLAIHLKPAFLVIEKNKPNTSLWSGIVLPFKKSDEQSSFLNLEIFYSLNDLFNTSASKDNLLGRNMIGLSATLPINFYNPKLK